MIPRIFLLPNVENSQVCEDILHKWQPSSPFLPIIPRLVARQLCSISGLVSALSAGLSGSSCDSRLRLSYLGLPEGLGMGLEVTCHATVQTMWNVYCHAAIV